MIDKKVKVPVREQEPKVRAGNFKEVCYGYDTNEAMLEATRCLNCKNPRCVQACPVGTALCRQCAAGFVRKNRNVKVLVLLESKMRLFLSES